MYIETQLQPLLDAARSVIDNADTTGCSDDLTVTSQSAIDRLEKSLGALQSLQLTLILHHHSNGVSTICALTENKAPVSDAEALAVLAEDYEPDKEEWVEVLPIANEEFIQFPGKCRRCDSPLTTDGWCSDHTCPHSDWPQSVPVEDEAESTARETEVKYNVKKRDRASESDE